MSGGGARTPMTILGRLATVQVRRASLNPIGQYGQQKGFQR